MQTLRTGSQGPDVRRWQEFLAAQGYDVTPDGNFGPHTAAATKAYQQAKGLTADGVVGDGTWAAACQDGMQAAAAAPAPADDKTAPVEPPPQAQDEPSPLNVHGDHDGHDSDIVQHAHPPVTGATRLGQAVLAKVESMLNLREDAGPNQDHGGQIRKFFIEGVQWPPSTWDNWSGVPAKPEWCAAFASYCTRQGYGEIGAPVPVKLCASADDTERGFSKANRFIARAALFAADGSVIPGARRPGPGDMIVWRNHVGLLKELRDDGTFLTVEGNTWQGTVRNDGVYQLTRKSTEKMSSGDWKLHGFCLTASFENE